MPQMAPLNWVTLFLFFILIFFMFNIMNYFMSLPLKTFKKSSKTQIKISWKW
uniref:ATP synthase complex subunit 8 n=1 Tax=Curculionoidea sp. 14 KM-2017 TaxID=2219397 RepID=A0A346RG34_9CUCU|nr:ATP synthase F0 subunit 8 [Curculionoidea sp. 14 KM-2017]